MKAARSLRIDTLRGIAVFGIMLVNVWGFAIGNNFSRYGVIGDKAPLLDQLVVFMVAAFAEQKFYPVFAFLFGAGFALQTGGRHFPGPQLDRIKTTYRRRVTWLLGCGVLHGSLLWFGDILTVYAICGFWLLTHAGRRLSGIVAALRRVAALNVAVLVFMACLTYQLMTMPPEAVAWDVDEIARTHALYSEGTLGEIARERLSDYWGNLANSLFFLPKVALLFLMGVLSVRLGWLTRPERHRALWGRVLLAALWVGLPLNLWWGWAALRDAIDPHAGGPMAAFVSFFVEVAGPLMAAGYVALVMRAPQWLMAALARSLAPVGRMALTNYLAQSVLFGFLLQGTGLRLGALLSHAGLVGVCLLLMVAQAGFSRWWMRRHTQGPMEAVWRRFAADA
ncbi:DUF418 domain-containing protein [Massilia violaceinigra]|uniref:DUF418 domain-containing protein n=1 Tax=Massilia violaceinigra TaxID=2045208 RepID=A0ABY4A3H6_9BURK|nr:DUF418 domain-containing protein [Massilia violaceinigra]UOD29312.1 DUF418 domain-containing protein [Massilia violaceinigra]